MIFIVSENNVSAFFLHPDKFMHVNALGCEVAITAWCAHSTTEDKRMALETYVN